MRARWNQFLDLLQTSFWFVPIVMLALSGGLALLLLYVDRRFDPGIHTDLGWAYTGGPEGARSLLSTIAGSMITAASVTFSLAAVALSIASQQYGSRVLRNFMRDKVTQILLGTFVSTFLYSVLVVRAIRGTDISGGFVPAIAVTVGIALAVISLVLLVYFIHHVSFSIQASRIVNVIGEDMQHAIPRLYPSQANEPLDHSPPFDVSNPQGRTTLNIERSGYLQSIELDHLIKRATENNIVIEVPASPGDHLVYGDPAAYVYDCTHPSQPPTLAPETREDILRSFLLGGERTPLQDIRYQFKQLTDVVIRALSPGINDPFTALNGIDKLATGISLMARRDRVSDKRQDKDGKLRLILSTPAIPELLRETVGHIAIYAAGDHFVMAGLRRVLDVAERDAQTDDERQTILQLREDLNRRESRRAAAS